MHQPRVPAWKRLGLKLKFAKDTDASSNVRDGSNLVLPDRDPVDKYNAAIVVGDTAARPHKKRRLREPSNICQSEATQSSPKLPASSLKDRGSALKKRVSFTPETKELDGDSSKSLIAAWELQAQNDQIEEFLQREAQRLVVALELPSTEEPVEVAQIQNCHEPNPFRERKRSGGEAGPLRKSKDALDYLKQHQDQRATWKFNKNREVWILKHALSIDAIPPAYDIALAHYVSGLKSAGAKSRLLEQCHDCIAALIEGNSTIEGAVTSPPVRGTTEDPKRRQAYYEAARERIRKAYEASLDQEEVGNHDETAKAEAKHNRFNRADKLLKTVEAMNSTNNGTMTRGNEFGEGSLTSTNRHSAENVPLNGVSKKRKNRTVVVDFSSSSEESDSDVSESEMEVHAKPNGKAHGKVVEENANGTLPDQL